MQKPLYLIFLLLLTFTCLRAQTAEEAAVTDVINQLFTGMYKGDSTMVRAAFARDVTSATSFRNKEGNPVLRRENSIDSFVKAVGQKQPEPLTEEIWNIKVQIDGDLAQVWCDYAFYVGHKFSHCGVDAFQLHKSKDGWKIFHLADTRRKEACNIPNEIQKKHQ
jgi:hypothetical protein